MVRTGVRARTLKELLTGIGLRPAPAAPSAPRIEALHAELANRVGDFYQALGGRFEAVARLRPGPWDLAFEGSLVVELDEELHFNRYRALALEADCSSTLPWRDDYLTFCREHEAQCLSAGTWGKRWTTTSSEVMFGAADAPGILGPRGAPRWKQRALYDLIKDLAALSDTSLRLLRLSTYDSIDGVAIDAALLGHAAPDPEALADLVKRRST